MPVKTVRKSLKKARKSIRSHWSEQEKDRRREMADLMQRRLILSLSGKQLVG